MQVNAGAYKGLNHSGDPIPVYSQEISRALVKDTPL